MYNITIDSSKKTKTHGLKYLLQKLNLHNYISH